MDTSRMSPQGCISLSARPPEWGRPPQSQKGPRREAGPVDLEKKRESALPSPRRVRSISATHNHSEFALELSRFHQSTLTSMRPGTLNEFSVGRPAGVVPPVVRIISMRARSAAETCRLRG
jgi:hypothetical protein